MVRAESCWALILSLCEVRENMIKMKYLFFRGLGFIIYYIFKVLTIIFLSQIQCLGFLKHAKINSMMFIWLFLRLWLHNLKKSQTLQNLWPGWFLFKKRISINCYSFVLCVLRSTMFKTKIFDLLLKCSSLFYCWFFIYNTVRVIVITAFLGIFFWYCTNCCEVFAHWTEVEALQILLHLVCHL